MAPVELYLGAVVEKMKECLLKEDRCHCDETPIQVLKEEGRKNTSRSYMWVYSIIALSSRPIRLFVDTPRRGSQYPKEFLKGYGLRINLGFSYLLESDRVAVKTSLIPEDGQLILL